VVKVVREEEEAFLRTLGKGIRIFNYYILADDALAVATDNNELSEIWADKLKDIGFRQENKISGEFAFKLNDTYGFPIDLTELMAREKNWQVDMDGFEKALQEQKQRSRAAGSIETEDWIILDEHALTEFVGYDSLEIKSKITKYRKVKSKGKDAYQLILAATPFYAESGGQVGDTGELTIKDKKITITDTKKENNLVIHFADRLPDDLTGVVTAKVDAGKRKAIAIHHSATHLLHAALRSVLGTHVEQKGSLVNEEHLRFDFSHFAKMTDLEIRKVEALVNEKIRENIPVQIKEMPKEDALKLGAMALFGEKYADQVRVVIIDPAYSIELCGGTHVSDTGELGFFLIKQETAIAAGVRRIEAISGKAAEDFIYEQSDQFRAIRTALKNPGDLHKAIENLLLESGELKKKMESIEDTQLSVLKKVLHQKVQQLDGISFIGEIVQVNQADALKKLCFDLKNELENLVVILAANIAGRAAVAILIDEALVSGKNLNAAKMIKEQVAPLIKGGGGGQKTLATAGGLDPSQLKEAIELVKTSLSISS
jgi:alanyl-tRNA synthetase